MYRKEPTARMTLLWIPAVSIVSVAILAANSSRFSNTTYWAPTSIPIVILIVWKMQVRRRAALKQEPEPTPEQVAKLCPYGYLFLVIYFSSATAFLGYGAAVWYYQLDLSWTLFITFLSLFAIKLDVWAIIAMHTITESRIASRP